MPRFLIKKLIRDKLAELPEMKGVQTLNDSDYQSELKKKVLEEAQEISSSQSLEDVREEIADMMEVLESLMNSYNISKEQVLQIQKEKRQAKGGFEKRLYVDYAEVSDNAPSLKIYMAQPDKYPVLKGKV
jgi:predicted house-cleaning noncanonical NTP pyrophosphatase (MazG superfamily)